MATTGEPYPGDGDEPQLNDMASNGHSVSKAKADQLELYDMATLGHEVPDGSYEPTPEHEQDPGGYLMMTAESDDDDDDAMGSSLYDNMNGLPGAVDGNDFAMNISGNDDG